LATALKIEPRRPRRPPRKYLLWASWLSFLPDHALDSVLDAHDLPVSCEADGLQPLNRQYDAQLLPYPSLYLTAWPPNEPKSFSLRNYDRTGLTVENHMVEAISFTNNHEPEALNEAYRIGRPQRNNTHQRFQ
jgi:hypothetical protein